MDLDSVSIRALKDIMIRMGISPHDCFERRDLKKKLIDNVPELRMAMERRASTTSQSSTASFTSMGSSSSFSGGGAEREEQHKREAEDQRKKEEEEERKREQKQLSTLLYPMHLTCTMSVQWQ